MSYHRYSSGRQDANVLRSDFPLTNDQIARVAPSVFADTPHESRSERYSLVPTYGVLAGLRAEGFEVFEARQSKTRIPGKAPFTRHLLRLRHGYQAIHQTDGTAPEIVLINSHDGSSAYQLLAGFFRFVCSNGLIAGDITNDVKVHHSGDIRGRVIEGAYEVLSNLKEAEQRIELYKGIELKREEVQAFANAAVQLRWPGDDANRIIQPEAIVTARRPEDAQNDLWSVFNRTQENIIKGGIRTKSESGRRLRAKAVTSLTEDVKLNRALFTLADQLAKYKTGEENRLSDLIVH